MLAFGVFCGVHGMALEVCPCGTCLHFSSSGCLRCEPRPTQESRTGPLRSAMRFCSLAYLAERNGSGLGVYYRSSQGSPGCALTPPSRGLVHIPYPSRIFSCTYYSHLITKQTSFQSKKHERPLNSSARSVVAVVGFVFFQKTKRSILSP